MKDKLFFCAVALAMFSLITAIILPIMSINEENRLRKIEESRYSIYLGEEVNIGLNERGLIESYSNDLFYIRYKKEVKHSLVSATASLIGSNTEKFDYIYIKKDIIFKLNPFLVKQVN